MRESTAELLGQPLNCKWIRQLTDRSDYPGQTLLTRRHDVIERWAKARHAKPATGKGKMDVRDDGTGLRFDFPGMGRFQPISWEDWFREFDAYEMTFVFQDPSAEGDSGDRYRLITPDRLDGLGIRRPPLESP